MNKRLLAVLFAAVIGCTAFTGCGNGKKNSSGNKENDGSADKNFSEYVGDAYENPDASIKSEDIGEAEYINAVYTFNESVNTDNARLYESVIHTDEQLKAAFELFASHGESDFETAYFESIQGEIDRAKETLASDKGCGENIKYSFAAAEAYSVTDKAVKAYEKSYNDNKGANMPEYKLSAAYVVKGTMTAAGSTGEYSGEFLFIFVKLDSGEVLIHPYSTPVGFAE